MKHIYVSTTPVVEYSALLSQSPYNLIHHLPCQSTFDLQLQVYPELTYPRWISVLIHTGLAIVKDHVIVKRLVSYLAF